VNRLRIGLSFFEPEKYLLPRTVPARTYSIQIFAVALFGNHAVLLGSPFELRRRHGCFFRTELRADAERKSIKQIFADS
jgi:hypothetical protein